MDSHLISELYTHKGMSVSQIADYLGCSQNKVNYWLEKVGIQKRSISEALCVRRHGLGGGFSIKEKMTADDLKLYGLGVGIYWGEGNKRNRHTVRVGNTDPQLMTTFIEFLVMICGVKRDEIRYSLQLFTDIDEKDALNFWLNELNIKKSQIMPTINRVNSGKIGTYKVKNQHGVLTLYVFNMRLRNWLVDQLYVPR